jgi:maltose O-acetyltransferase
MNLKACGYDALLFLANIVVANFPSARARHLFYHRLMGIRIGPGARLMSGIWFDSKGNCSIGRNTVINPRCRLDTRGGLFIGENVSISPWVHLITADHDIDDQNFKGRLRPIRIGDRVFIGSRATVLPGVTIGEGAVVAACACVTRDVEPYSVVAGVPAREIRKRKKPLDYELHYERHFF